MSDTRIKVRFNTDKEVLAGYLYAFVLYEKKIPVEGVLKLVDDPKGRHRFQMSADDYIYLDERRGMAWSLDDFSLFTIEQPWNYTGNEIWRVSMRLPEPSLHMEEESNG